MPRFHIHHLTQYQYPQPVRYSANRIILYPIEDAYQEVVKHEITISENPDVFVHTDYYGNKVGSFTIIEPHDQLVIESDVKVITHPRPLPADADAPEVQWKQLHEVAGLYADLLKVEDFGSQEEIRELFGSIFTTASTPLQIASGFSSWIYNNFSYVKGVTTVESTLDEVWKLKSGVCQDFAHILLVLARLAGIPARYVSGYICPNNNGMRGEGATHAWAEVFIPGYGWLGLDPTNNCMVNETHVRLAVGKSFNDCSPVRGTYRGAAEHQLHVVATVAYEDDLLPKPPPVEVKKYDSSIPQEKVQSQQ